MCLSLTNSMPTFFYKLRSTIRSLLYIILEYQIVMKMCLSLLTSMKIHLTLFQLIFVFFPYLRLLN